MRKCAFCGKEDDTHLHLLERPHDGMGKIMIERGVCFHCAHWFQQVERAGDPNVVRVNNTHYYIGPKDAKAMKGFGGAEFKIHFTDGRKKADVETSNLWCQGNIPEHFRSLLPNNAEFVR